MDKRSKSFKGTISALPPVELALAVNTDESVRPKPGSSLSTRMSIPVLVQEPTMKAFILLLTLALLAISSAVTRRSI